MFRLLSALAWACFACSASAGRILTFDTPYTTPTSSVVNGKLTNIGSDGLTHPLLLPYGFAGGQGTDNPRDDCWGNVYYIYDGELGVENPGDLVTIHGTDFQCLGEYTLEAYHWHDWTIGAGVVSLGYQQIEIVPPLRPDGTYSVITLDNVQVPEPSTFVLGALFVGLIGYEVLRRWRRSVRVIARNDRKSLLNKSSCFGGYHMSRFRFLEFAAFLAPLFALPVVTSGGWSPVGEMQTARVAHSASILPDGKALVCGGVKNTRVLASCEVFDPKTSTWQNATPMNEARAYAEMISLPNGDVLAFGGRNDFGDLITAEVFSPGTSQWKPVGNLNVARHWPSVSVLEDGRVLIAGGWGGVFQSSAETYDPVTQTFSPAGSYPVAVNKQASVVLHDGRVLSFGGYGGGSSRYQRTESYAAASDAWSGAASMSDPRYRFSAVLLPDGRVLAVGGGSNGSGVLSSVEMYDAGENSWRQTGAMHFARSEGAPGANYAFVLNSGDVVAFGGQHPETEIYNSATESWEVVGTMSIDRGYEFASVQLADGSVLVTGGQYANEWLSSAEIFRPSVELPGDTDADGDVDLNDLNNVRNQFGNGEILGEPVFGEAFPFNGVVDLGDLNLVRNFFGVVVNPVPEPSSMPLLAAGVSFCFIAAIMGRRRIGLSHPD